MMDSLIPALARAHLSMNAGGQRVVRFFQGRAERLSDSDDRGADIFEWAGMLILVAAIIAGLYSLGIVDTVTNAVEDALKEIFEGDPGGEN
ncbi:hypothetical protein HUT06_09150 [Actinomadura sp. NAK00032]|uniref:hypothetical protein n=1 Tax=Actinomadura sp. NAK00032 TaxID=2742128 RepID=UPI0015915230|nr:hypothetical protein [Actinomadura sp. NAK00032]QKW34168.1 hypothetical protein HUT06_09150 [Actinomadura sp. NAK00032]